MNILHGVILRGTERETSHSLFLWVERAAQHWSPGVMVRQHPGCLTLTDVEREIRSHITPIVGAHRGQVELLLPTRSGRPAAYHEATNGIRMEPWRVSGVRPHRSSWMPLMEWLLGEAGDAGKFVIAGDLAYLARLSQWLWKMIAAGQVVPDVTVSPDSIRSKVSTVWRLAPKADAALERFAEHMPWAAAADERWLHTGVGRTADPRPAALRSFVTAMADQAVRHFLTLQSSQQRRFEGGRLIQRWVAALQDEEPDFYASKASATRFVASIEAWQRWGRSLPEQSAYQLVLQLAPVIRESDDGVLRVPEAWRLDYALRHRETGTVTHATELWDKDDATDPETLRSVLQQALVDAGRYYAPLLRSLSEAEPTGDDLSPEEVLELIDSASEALHHAGVIIQLPRWLDQAAASIRTRLVVDTSSSGELSFDTLVGYEWRTSIGDLDLDAEQFRRLTEATMPYVQVHGEWIAVRPEQIRRLVALRDRNDRSTGSIGQVMSEALSWADDVELDITGTGSENGYVSQRLHELWDALGTRREWKQLPAPAALKGELRPYQLRGFSWLSFMRDYRLGACLADDMGLGKTVQVIALLQKAKSEGQLGPTLVVCPTSVVENWRDEFAHFAPDLQVAVHHGAERRQGEQLVATIEATDVVITSYGLVLRDQEALSDISWDTIIADEAQNLKNPAAKQTRAVKALRAEHRIALTGTPIENRLLELWSIMDFLNPGYLGGVTYFRSEVAGPIERDGDDEALEMLRRRIGPFILRRSKADPEIVPELPDKIESKEYCTLTAEQAALYQSTVEAMMNRIEESEGMQRRGLVLASLTRLKQICNHPSLFYKETRSDPARSGKLQRLIEMTQEVIDRGEKALIFTQYAQMGRLLKTTLSETVDNEVLLLHGGVPRAHRTALVKRFQSGKAPLFILSLRAGGVGLNLTEATHVFHFDRWWNPAVENQATDRAYRIGQTATVHVHKFICKGTLEDNIDRLIEEKKALAEDVIDSGEHWLSELSNEQLHSLFALQSEVSF